ncbi:MAG: hypothetical protein H8E12_07825 [Rhodobacteraceae bacterium]|nr:hypothetical protein [Paracoccaceae bacterium]
MFTPIRKEDKQVTPFTVHKEFSVQNYAGINTLTDYGVMQLEAIEGNLQGFSADGRPAFETSSANVNTFVSGGSTFKVYKAPLFKQIKHNFFEFANPNNRVSPQPQPQNVLDVYCRPWGHPKSHDTGSSSVLSYDDKSYHWQTLGLRQIYSKVNVVSIPQSLFGESIKSGSIEITDYSSGDTLKIVDDGYGNLYDQAYEAEFNNGRPTSVGSGSSSGVVSYEYGLVMLSTTSSYYAGVISGSGATGWKLKWQSTKTIYEHEYQCIIPSEKYNASSNISTTFQRSGSITIPESSVSNLDLLRQVMPPAETQYNTGSAINAATTTEGFVTHSFFAPYITTVGLYNDAGDLVAVAKTSRAIRNDPEIAMSFVVRFDI